MPSNSRSGRSGPILRKANNRIAVVQFTLAIMSGGHNCGNPYDYWSKGGRLRRVSVHPLRISRQLWNTGSSAFAEDDSCTLGYFLTQITRTAAAFASLDVPFAFTPCALRNSRTV